MFIQKQRRSASADSLRSLRVMQAKYASAERELTVQHWNRVAVLDIIEKLGLRRRVLRSALRQLVVIDVRGATPGETAVRVQRPKSPETAEQRFSGE